MSVRFTRDLHAGATGVDIEGVGRALCRAGVLYPISLFNIQPSILRRRYGGRKITAVERFQRKHLLKVDGVYGQATHAKLSPFFDSKAKYLMNQWQALSWQDVVFNKLLASMREMSDHTPGYLLGGGHGIPIHQISPYEKLDCSSSVSKALYDAGLFRESEAWVSGQLENWGEAGPGKYFSVYANYEHVWIRMYKSRWWRFDTSPQGDSAGDGPRLRYLPRFTSSFVVRHARGM